MRKQGPYENKHGAIRYAVFGSVAEFEKYGMPYEMESTGAVLRGTIEEMQPWFDVMESSQPDNIRDWFLDNTDLNISLMTIDMLRSLKPRRSATKVSRTLPDGHVLIRLMLKGGWIDGMGRITDLGREELDSARVMIEMTIDPNLHQGGDPADELEKFFQEQEPKPKKRKKRDA